MSSTSRIVASVTVVLLTVIRENREDVVVCEDERESNRAHPDTSQRNNLVDQPLELRLELCLGHVAELGLQQLAGRSGERRPTNSRYDDGIKAAKEVCMGEQEAGGEWQCAVR